MLAFEAAQTINVNFADVGSAPASTYAAAGAAGMWNTITGVAGPSYTLVTTDGAASGVTMTQSPTTTLLSSTDPALSGDDAKLLNTGLVTTGAETCLMFSGVEPGTYEVLIYAWTPNGPSVMSRTRQDEAPSTKDIGGAWTGAQVEGVTYARYVVTVDASGMLPAHSGLASGQPSAALNAVQIRPLTSVPPMADAGTSGDAMTVTSHGGGCAAGGDLRLGVLVAFGLLLRRRR